MAPENALKLILELADYVSVDQDDHVMAQSVILEITHNVSKYHNKIQAGKTGHHLFGLKEIA